MVQLWWLTLSLWAICVNSLYDTIVNFYDTPYYEGKPIQLRVNEAVTNGTFKSVRSDDPNILVEVYSEIGLSGNKTYILAHTRLRLYEYESSEIKSYRVVHKSQVLQDTRKQQDDIVLTLAPPNRGYRIEYRSYSVGEDVPSVLPWIIQAMDIPQGVSVEAFYSAHYLYNSYEVLHTTQFTYARSFKVRRNGQVVPKQSSTAILFSHDGGSDIIIQEGDQVPLIESFKNGGFHIGLFVPQNYKLVAYNNYDFVGEPTLFHAGFDQSSRIGDMNSFRYLKESDEIPTAVDPSLIVSCGLTNYSYNHLFRLGARIPCLQYAQECHFYKIPQGLAMVGYDRPWWLGSSFVLLEDGEIPPNFGTRSLKIVLAKDAPTPNLPKIQKIDLRKLNIKVFPTFSYRVNEMQPVLHPFEEKFIDAGSSFANLPKEIVVELYDDYNFRGQSVHITSTSTDSVLPVYDPSKPLKRFKSFRFLNMTTKPMLTPFVCFYPTPTGFNIFPICLEAGEKVPSLIYPWEVGIHNVTVPDGLVAIVYSERDGKGDCQAYFNNTPLDQVWKSRVLSIAAKQKEEWGGCPQLTTTPVSSTTTKPQTTTIDLSTEPLEDEILPGLNESLQPSQQSNGAPSTSLPTIILNDTQNKNLTSTNKTSKPTVPSKKDFQTTPAPQDIIEHEKNKPVKHSNQPASTSYNGLYIALPLVGVAALLAAYILNKQRSQNKGTTTNLEIYSSINWGDMDLLQLYVGLFPLTHEIASGSAGCLYLGSFQGQQVAIKTLHPNPTGEAVQSFIDEIQLLGTIKCPYIVTLIGVVWTSPTNIQSVMEYMNLGDLRMYLSSTTVDSFSWSNKLQCALCIARGLFYLHSQQTIHRDLKSRNVLLDSTKGTKLADFSSAKDQVYEGETMTAMIGTFRWMAPEMMLFKGYTSAVDVYSFGVVLSEMSTHKLPYYEYEGQSDESIVSRVLHNNLRPSIGDGCPKWLEMLAKRCMSGEPEDRPTTCQLIYILELNIKNSAKCEGQQCFTEETFCE